MLADGESSTGKGNRVQPRRQRHVWLRSWQTERGGQLNLWIKNDLVMTPRFLLCGAFLHAKQLKLQVPDMLYIGLGSLVFKFYVYGRFCLHARLCTHYLRA